MSDVKNTSTLNRKGSSSERMQSHHAHQSNQTTHISQSDRAKEIFSLDVKERTAMARKGENLDILMHDSCTMVRREVALRGYNLDELAKDSSNIVREAVARCGYESSAALIGNSGIVRQAAAEAEKNFSHERSKTSGKMADIIDKLDSVNSKLDKFDTAKSTHRVRMYTEYGSNRVHVAVDTTKMSREQYAQHKHDNRGLLHKIDSHFQNANVGLVYAKVRSPLTYGDDGKRHLQSPITMHSLSPPKILQQAGNKGWNIALKAEAGLFRYGDTAKRLIIDPASQAARVAVLNELYRASKENIGIDMVSKGARAGLTVARGIMNYRRDMIAYKPVRLENKRDKLLKRGEKIKLNAATYHSKELFYAANERANSFGLKRSGRKSKPAFKGAWTKIYDGSQHKGYLQAPEKAHLDKSSMSKTEFKHQKKMNRLERKEFKMNKKAYSTVKVKQKYFNASTGKFQTKTVKMVDKSKLKKPKVKKPDSLAVRPALAGLGALRNKAFNELSQSDNVAVQAVGKSANAAFSEFSRMRASSLKKKNQLYEKRVNKARMKAEKTGAKLEVEKNKSPFSEKSSKKANKKKAQKKRLRKKRNAEMFKQNMKKAAKKARDEIARKAADFIAGKGKFIALGVLGFILMMMAPMIFLMMMGGGGGGVLGGATALSVYPVDNKTLTDSLLSYNDELDDFYEECVTYVQGLQAENGRTISTKDKIYGGVSFNFSGIKATFRYDIFKLASYLSAKYRNDWSSAQEECRQLVRMLFKIDCVEENGDHIHREWEAQIGSTRDGDPIYTTMTMDIYNFYIYPKDGVSIDEFITEQLSNMGEVTEDGKTNYELHYELLMESDGGHQKIGTPLPGFDYWTRSSQTSIYEHIPPNQQDTFDNCIGIACGSGQSVTAGGDGVITSIGDNSITVEYEDFVVTYYGDVSSTQLGKGSVVSDGDILFTTAEVSEDSENPYNLQISVYDNSVSSYVNPAFVMEGYEGQMEDNKRRQDEANQQPTEETPME